MYDVHVRVPRFAIAALLIAKMVALVVVGICWFGHGARLTVAASLPT